MRQRHAVIGPGAGESVWWKDMGVITFKVGGGETGGAYSLVEARMRTGGGADPHLHPDEDEIFYVVSGRLRLTVGDRTLVAEPGAFALIPWGVGHAFVNEWAEEAVFLNPFVPPGLEGMFRDGGTPRRSPGDQPPRLGPADVARAIAAAKRHRVVMNPGPQAWGASPGAVVLLPGERATDGQGAANGVVRSVKLSEDRTDGTCSITELRVAAGGLATTPPGSAGQRGYYMADGDGEFEAEGYQFRATRGSFVLIEGGCGHTLRAGSAGCAVVEFTARRPR